MFKKLFSIFRSPTVCRMAFRPKIPNNRYFPMISSKAFATFCNPAAVPITRSHQGTNEFYIEQILTGCLAEYSYFISSESEAAVIDPIKDIEVYIELAKMKGVKIKYIFETHFHADFVSGHQELSRKTGAQIVFGPLASSKFKFYHGKDHEQLQLGKIFIEILHTPGHTLESTSFLLRESHGTPHSIFTGDTLFIDEVGRPDLASNDMIKPKDLASLLFDSIRQKIMPLPDNVYIYPGHGAGSPCGKTIGSGDYSTIGQQKSSNYSMVKDLSKEDFVKIATSDLPKPLGYMGYDVSVNKGEKNVKTEKDILGNRMSFYQIKELLKSNPNALILDTRADLSKGILKNSINIGLNTSFSIYVGTVISPETPLILVSENDQSMEQSIIRLLRVGYDNIIGFLDGGIANWTESADFIKINNVSVEDFKKIYEKKNEADHVILDVRNKPEWNNGVLKNATLISLRDLEEATKTNAISKLKNKKIYIHCRTGPRATIGQSLLLKNGFTNVVQILGGYNEMKEKGIEFIKPL